MNLEHIKILNICIQMSIGTSAPPLEFLCLLLEFYFYYLKINKPVDNVYVPTIVPEIFYIFHRDMLN